MYKTGPREVEWKYLDNRRIYSEEEQVGTSGG